MAPLLRYSHSIYKTPELKLGPNLISSGPIEPIASEPAFRRKRKVYFTEAQFQDFEKMKIGKLVRETLPLLLQGSNLSEATMLDLQSVARSKKIFDVNFPVLKKVPRNALIEARNDPNGYPRYYSRPVYCNSSEYLITSEWYKGSHRRYLKWLRKVAYKEGIEA